MKLCRLLAQGVGSRGNASAMSCRLACENTCGPAHRDEHGLPQEVLGHSGAQQHACTRPAGLANITRSRGQCKLLYQHECCLLCAMKTACTCPTRLLQLFPIAD